MKVYVVGINIFDEADIVAGVYDSEEKAREAQEKLSPYVSDTYGECDVTLTSFEMNETYIEKESHEKEVDYDMLDEYLGSSVIRIYIEDGIKYIKYLGYGYMSEGDTSNNCKDYRVLEYSSFEVPLQTVLDYGAYPEEYEEDYGYQYKQYISDVTAKELVDDYQHWDNGNHPKELYKLTIDTPPGVYILL